MATLPNAETFRTVLEQLQTGVYLVDKDRRIVFWNDGAERITGYLRHQVLGHFCRENVVMDCNEESCGLCGTVCPLAETLHEGRPKEAHVFFHHKQGHQVPVLLRVVPIRDEHGSIIGAAESFEPQVADSTSNDDLARYGCLDPTGVPNHAFTQSHLRACLSTFTEHHVPFSIIGVHVDRLRKVQATHGHEATTAILRAAAGTIQNVIGPSSFVGRWMESEFLAILTAPTPSQVEKIVENIQKAVNCSSIKWWDDPLLIHVTVGHTEVQAGDTLESLTERVGRMRQSAALGARAVSASGLGL